MVLEKKPLSFADVEAQTALELPDRETPAIAVISCLAICIGTVSVSVRDVNLAVQLCAEVEAITINGQSVFNCQVVTSQR
jgi:hypothetical protein